MRSATTTVLLKRQARNTDDLVRHPTAKCDAAQSGILLPSCRLLKQTSTFLIHFFSWAGCGAERYQVQITDGDKEIAEEMLYTIPYTYPGPWVNIIYGRDYFWQVRGGRCAWQLHAMGESGRSVFR